MPLAINQEKISPRRGLVLFYIAKGLCDKAIAKMLGISMNTVKSHRTALLYVFHAKNTAQMIARAFEKDVLRYTPIFLLCMSIAFGGFSNARPVRRNTRTATYTRTMSRNEISA